MIFSGKFDIFVTKFYHLFVMLMNLIGFDIENLSYNWSIITYRDSNTNSIEVFYSIKLINKKANRKFDCCANTLLKSLYTFNLPLYLFEYYLKMNYQRLHALESAVDFWIILK